MILMEKGTEQISRKEILERTKIPNEAYGFLHPHMTEHLLTLYDITASVISPDKIIVELGVGRGESTAALLAAVNDTGGHLYGIDIRDCGGIFDNEPNWTFIRGDDLEIVKEWNRPIDHLFIDTSHRFEQTIAELRAWSPWIADREYGVFKPGIISLHDIHLPGVKRAVETFLEENPKKYNLTVYPGRFSLGTLVYI